MFRLLHCFVECASRLKLIFGVIVSPVSKALVVSQPGVLCFGFPLSFQHVSDSFCCFSYGTFAVFEFLSFAVFELSFTVFGHAFAVFELNVHC